MEEIEYFDCVPPHLQGVMLFRQSPHPKSKILGCGLSCEA